MFHPLGVLAASTQRPKIAGTRQRRDHILRKCFCMAHHRTLLRAPPSTTPPLLTSTSSAFHRSAMISTIRRAVGIGYVRRNNQSDLPGRAARLLHSSAVAAPPLRNSQSAAVTASMAKARPTHSLLQLSAPYFGHAHAQLRASAKVVKRSSQVHSGKILALVDDDALGLSITEPID